MKHGCEIIPADDNFDNVAVCYYTDFPHVKFDAFVRKEFRGPDYGYGMDFPIYYYEESWSWDGRKYVKNGFTYEKLSKSKGEQIRRTLLCDLYEDYSYTSKKPITII